MKMPICFFRFHCQTKTEWNVHGLVSNNCDSAQVMAASNAGAFRRARISSTWIPRQIRNIIACSQTLYFFLKGFIDRQRKEVVVGEEKKQTFYVFLSRAPRSALRARFARELADVFEKNEKKNKTTSLYRLGIYSQRGTKNTGPVQKLSP